MSDQVDGSTALPWSGFSFKSIVFLDLHFIYIYIYIYIYLY